MDGRLGLLITTRRVQPDTPNSLGWPTICRSVHLSICLSVCLSVCRAILLCPSVCFIVNENDRRGYQELCSCCEAYGLKKHGLTRADYICMYVCVNVCVCLHVQAPMQGRHEGGEEGDRDRDRHTESERERGRTGRGREGGADAEMAGEEGILYPPTWPSKGPAATPSHPTPTPTPHGASRGPSPVNSSPPTINKVISIHH